MKRKLIFIFTVLFLFSCHCLVSKEKKQLVDLTAFKTDLSSENYKLRGKLKRYVYNSDLSALTYDSYIIHLKKNLSPSAEGLPEKIQSADSYIFKTKKESYLIALTFLKDKIVIIDDANTDNIDETLTITNEVDFKKNIDEIIKKLNY